MKKQITNIFSVWPHSGHLPKCFGKILVNGRPWVYNKAIFIDEWFPNVDPPQNHLRQMKPIQSSWSTLGDSEAVGLGGVPGKCVFKASQVILIRARDCGHTVQMNFLDSLIM